MRKSFIALGVFAFVLFAMSAYARPVPSKALEQRLKNGPEIIGILHFGLNTYTDKEWGYGNANAQLFAPEKFDAEKIVDACKAGGIGGLVVVAKHHDGFCLWPTKTTSYNISRSPFRSGKGDFVREMCEACRKGGIKFGVYISPWDRNNADYASEKYVHTYHEQIKELLGGDYGEIFEMWFDGANGGTGWYGGADENRIIPKDYYRFGEIFQFVRELQPMITIFDGGRPDSDFRWPGNERGLLDANSRATTLAPCEEGYRKQLNTGTAEGSCFLVCEADFPLRRGWFYHESERGTTKNSAYLTKLYLSSVGNGGTMNIGIAPNKEGVIVEEDIRALRGFKIMKEAMFSKEATNAGEEFNVVTLEEDLSAGEQVDEWAIIADGKGILWGESIGRKRIRLLKEPVAAKNIELVIKKHGGNLQQVTFRRYFADPSLVAAILEASTTSGETDTAKWMTKGKAED
ncbi:MAG: alpha-L-fucosidase [Kiritimatiellae bacterium]|nr:alpha-L-fucosidase [Kiritimatiellia bacterium]